MLTEHGLLDAKPLTLPLEQHLKVANHDGVPLPDPSVYHKIVGQLLYLTVLGPDISYATHHLSQFMQQPTTQHLQAATCVLRHLKGTIGQGIFYPSSNTLHLTAYCYSDWASCSVTRKSTSGYSMMLGSSLVSWMSKKQNVVARSSSEAEYGSLATSTCEVIWLHPCSRHSKFLFLPLSPFSVIDNQPAIQQQSNSPCMN